MNIEVFVPAKKAKVIKREHHLTVGKSGRSMLTTEGKQLLAVLAENHLIQGKANGKMFIAKRPDLVNGGFKCSEIKGSLVFGSNTLLQLFSPGRYKLVNPTTSSVPDSNGNNTVVLWYELEAVASPTKAKAE